MHAINIRIVVTALTTLSISFSSLTIASNDHHHDTDPRKKVLHEQHEDDKHLEDQEVHSDSTEISDEQITLSNIKTEQASLREINISTTLFGVVSTAQDKTFRVFSTYESLVKKVHVSEGQKVKKRTATTHLVQQTKFTDLYNI